MLHDEFAMRAVVGNGKRDPHGLKCREPALGEGNNRMSNVPSHRRHLARCRIDTFSEVLRLQRSVYQAL
ncbi:MAG: hypothetical protein QOI13_1604 [Paraburkholderia sp.]|nr:hypothetical protein [Paraburkholderia sp.]